MPTRDSLRRAAACAAFALPLAFAGCGGGGGSGSSGTVPPPTVTPTPAPAILVRNESSQTPLDTSASNPGRLNAGTSATLIVYETTGYSGFFSATVLPVSVPAGSKICVNADLAPSGSGSSAGEYMFVGTTLNQVADPGCLFPQTVDIHLSDTLNRTGDLFVKVVTNSSQ